MAVPSIRGSRGLLLLTVGLELLALAAGFLVWTRHDFRTAAARAEAEAEAAAVLLEEHVLRTLGTVDCVLLDAGRLVGEVGLAGLRTRGAWKQLSALSRPLPPSGALFVYDASGETVAASASFPPPAFNASGRDYFKSLTAGTGDWAIGSALPGQTVHKRFFPVARAVRDGAGRCVAVVQVGLDAAYLAGLFRNVEVGAGKTVGLYLTRDGAVVARHPASDGSPDESIAGAPYFRLLAAGGGRSWKGWLASGGREQLVAARRLKDFPLIVTASTPRAEVFGAPRQRLLWNGVALLLAGAALSSLGAALWMDRGRVRRAAADRQRVREALRESEAFHREILDALPAHMAVLDRGGRIVAVNRAWSEFAAGNGAGRSKTVTVGANYFEVCRGASAADADDAARAVAGIQAVIDGRLAAFHMEYPCHSPWEQRWFLMSVVPLSAGPEGSVVVTHLDVSERRRADEALRESEEHYRRLFETMLHGVVYQDAEGRITSMNPAAERILGKSPEDFLGETSVSVENDTIREDGSTFPGVEHPSMAALRTGEEQRDVVMGVFNPREGGRRWIRVTAVPVLSPGDASPRHVYTVFDDITEERRAAEELRLSKEAAEEASRAKSDFLARMSHEIRTPMNAIMGMTDLALMDDGLPPRTREYLKLAKQSSKGLLSIINDVLDLARVEAGRMEVEERTFDLPGAVASVVSTFGAAAAKKGLRLVCDVGPDVPRVVVSDEGKLRQVLTNLVGNAMKFTSGGEVGVKVERAAGGEGRPRAGRACLLFSVRDTGIGIAADALCTVFDTFSGATRSTHAQFGGTGLGLSIARQLVELLGGRIWAESEPGRGSTFRFTVDVGVGAAEAAVPEETDPPATPRREGRRLKVLVAEDNALNRLYAEELLSVLGHEAVSVSDGDEALERLAAGDFHAALMDVQMPKVDGLEATRRIRQGEVPGCPRDLPVVAVTAHAIEGDRERFLAGGMDAYLAKPFELEGLKEALESVAGK